MRLYEATNGWMGYSYARCLVWAKSEKEALKLARAKYKEEADQVEQYDDSYYKNIELELIFDAEKQKKSFATEIRD